MKSPAKKKNEESKHFTLIFMRCWCYLPVSLVYLGTVSLWSLISAVADSHCQKPKSLQIISHMTQACMQWCSSWNLLPAAVFITLKLRLCWVNRTDLVLTGHREKRREKKQAWEKPRYAKCLQLPASILPFTIYEQVVTGDCNDCSY